jgi:ATP-dependent DNA ligase
MPAKVRGRFIEPMLLLRTDSLPNDGDRWEYELKFDGYRAIAFKTGGKLHLRSRNDNDFSLRYADVVKGLAKLPDETVIDGEVIALDDDGTAVIQHLAELRLVESAGPVFRVRCDGPCRTRRDERAA